MMRCAASAMVCSPEEQKRLPVIPRTAPRAAGADGDLARVVPPGGALRVGAADDHVLDLVGVELRALERGVHHVSAHLGAVGVVERAPPALAKRRARRGHNDGFSHVFLSYPLNRLPSLANLTSKGAGCHCAPG